MAARAAVAAERIVERIIERAARAREAARPAQGLHAEGHRRRPQGLPAHRRVRGRAARRDLHRHAQGGRRLPLADEQLRHRHLARPAVRRAAGGVRRRLHLHPLRAGGPGAGQRHDQERHLDPRLHLPRAGGLLPRPQRPGPRRPERGRQHRARLVGGGAGGGPGAAAGRQVTSRAACCAARRAGCWRCARPPARWPWRRPGRPGEPVVAASPAAGSGDGVPPARMARMETAVAALAAVQQEHGGGIAARPQG